MRQEDLKITINKQTSADALMAIAKQKGCSRNSILKKIVSDLSEHLPDLKPIPERQVSVLISGVSPVAKLKINRYCNSVGTSVSTEMRRAIANYLIQNHPRSSQFDL